MPDPLTILGAIILGVVGNAAWDLCKTVYRKRHDDELTLLGLFKRDQIQTLDLSNTYSEKNPILDAQKEKVPRVRTNLRLPMEMTSSLFLVVNKAGFLKNAC